MRTMYEKLWHFQVLDRLADGKPVFALDTRDNRLYDLKNEKVGEVVNLIKLAKENDDRIFFYYWKEKNEIAE